MKRKGLIEQIREINNNKPDVNIKEVLTRPNKTTNTDIILGNSEFVKKFNEALGI